MKKVISIILSLVMLFSLLPTQTFAANQYTDTAGNWAEGAIDRWSEYGVIEGSNGKFDPNGTLTRAQMAAILSRLLALPEAKNAGFSDVKETDWYAPYINSCYASGIMLGSDGKAQPNDPITREQAIVMLSRALGVKPIENADLSGYTDALTVSDWAKGYVAAMAQAGIVKGTSDTTVSPKASIDRAATVTILDRAIGTYVNVDNAEVTAADSGVILIAADNVKVTGAAKGATVIVSPSADGVTVNGAAVAAGTTTTAAEEKQDKPVVSGGGGGGGGGPTPSYSDLTIDEAKTVTGGTYKDVTITSAVGNGDVTLNNVTIKGKLIVQGGGENSIHLDGCKVDTIQVDKDTSAEGAQQPRIELNNTPVETIEAVQPVIIEADQKSTVKAVEAKSDVTVKGAATEVKKVTVPESAASTGVELKIEGAKVSEVKAEDPVTINATAGASPIEKVEAKDNLTVMGNAAQIKQVEVPKSTDKEPVIDVQAGTVAEVKADKPAEIKSTTGNGAVTNVEANAAVTVASATVTTITVTVQVTVTVTGNQPVEVAVATEQAVNITTQGNATVAVSTTVETSVDVKLNNTQVTHVHKWQETGRTNATCSATGSVTYTCSGEGTCDKSNTKTESLPKLAHKEVIDDAVPATCTTDGKTAGKHCSECKEVLIAQQTVTKLGHAYGEASYTWAKDGNAYKCTATRVCTHDASHKETETVTATYAVTTSATCETNGVGTYTATFTNGAFAEQTKTEEIAALGHDYTVAQHDDARHWMKCSRCDSTTAKTDHSYDAHSCDVSAKCKGCEYEKLAGEHSYGAYTQTKAPTCTEKGSEKAICSICQHEDVRDVAALGHSWATEFTIDTPATCTTVGSKSYHCTRCDAKNDMTEIPSTGHSFADAWSHDDTYHWHVCTRGGCNAIDGKAEHTWDAGVVTTPAGVQDGEKTYTCTVCGATKKEVIHSTNTEVTDYAGFVDALNNNTVTGVTINADITVPAQNEWTVLEVAKPVVVAAGKTLTVAGYTTDGDKFGFLANDLTIVEGGSLTLEGGATLKTTAIKSSENEPFYNYTGRVCVAGGTLDVSKGTVAEGSFFNYSYGDSCTNSDALTLGDNTPAIEFAVHNDAQLRAAIADSKCTGGVIVENNITLENDLTVTKLVLINEQWTLTVPAEKTLTVADGGKLQVSGTLFVYGTLNNAGEIFNLNLIDVFGGGTLTNSGKIDGNWYPNGNGNFACASSLGIEGGAKLNNTGTINDCIAVADYYGYGANKQNKLCTVTGIDAIDPGNVDKMAVVFDTTQIQTLLNKNNSYEIVMPCGTNATQDNTINLGNITVPTGKTLLLKASVFDGTNTYRNSFTCADVKVEQSGAVVVRSGSSLTVTGTLTLATSSEEYWMNDSGSIQVQSGGSLTIGGVQYTGENGALSLSNNTWLVLSGVPKDVAIEAKPTGIFTILTGDAEVKSGKTFTVPAAWDNFILVDGAVLTVNGTLTNNGRMENRGTLNVYGTLNNVGTIDNQHFIDVIGGTLSNSGKIDGKKENESDERYASNIAIESGATLDNTNGTINDCITVADYYRAGETVKQCHWNARTDDHTFDPVFEGGKDNPNFDVMALAFGTEQVKAALNAKSYWGEGNEQHSAYTYESVLACGTATEGVNTVELGGIEVHEFGALVLKDEVFDGTNVYHNQYVISSDETLKLQEGAALVGVGKDGNSKVGLEINGNIVNNGGFVDFNQFNLSGTKVVHNKTELATALEKGGTIILLPFAQGDPNRDEDSWEEIGTVYESQYRISNSGDNYLINKNTELIGLGTGNEIVAVFFDDGFTVDSDKTLKIDGLNIVAVTNSTVNGTVEVYNNAQLIVQGKEGTTLTINGKVFVGEGEATALAIYAEEGVNNKIVNDGTIENSGKLIFDRDSQYSGSGTIEDASVVDVSSEQELMAALDNHIVSEIHIKDEWSITGTKDNVEDDETVLRLESRNDKDLRVVIDDDAELTVPQHVRLEVSQRAELQIAEGGKLILYGGLNVFGGLKPDEWDVKDDEGQGVYVVEKDGSYINFFPDVMEFGKRLLECVGAYELEQMDKQEIISDNQNRANEWPDLSEENEDRSDGFLFAVKYGLEPHTEKDDQGNDYIVWRPYDKITYGEAMTVLRGVYKAIYKDTTELPDSVALGEGGWTPNDNDCISDNDVNNLLNKFVAALPPVEADVFTFIVERKDCSQGDHPNCGGEGWHELVNGSHDNTVRNLHFTQLVTISNATTGLPENDTWGGKIRFENCVFERDINVTYNPACDFRVEFDESCEFKNGAKVDVKQAQSEDSKDLLANRNVTVYFDCTGGKVVSSARARAEAANNVSFLFNGVTVSGTNADNGGFGACMYFNCDAEHDNSFDWDENDHSACEGNVCGEYQFTTDGNAAMTVSGTTAENCPIRLSGIVDISDLTALENQEITLHYWSKCRDDNGNETDSHNTDVKIGGHSVSINDSGDYVVSGTGTVTVPNQNENARITVNGKELGSPHVFGNGGGIYLGLTNTDGVSFALEQWDEETGNTSWINIENFNAVLYNESGPVTEQNPTPTKLQLEKKDDKDWITDPNNVRLTVTVNGLSVVYDPLKNKVENDTED